ncbi:MAG: hypothetical protein NTU49_00305 [Gammaproteobacteria bacterium]|nr:hypothetical protein [Gammaproteobacteria bacterium]
MAEFTRIYYLYCENDRRSFFGHKLGWLGEILKNDKLSDGQRLLIVLQRIENNPDSRTDKAFQQAVYSLFFQEEKNKLTGENPALSDDQKKKLEKVQTALTLSVKAVDGIIADQNIIAGRQIHHDIQKGRSDFSNKKIIGNVSDVSKKTIINFTNADLTQATIDVSILKNSVF